MRKLLFSIAIASVSLTAGCKSGSKKPAAGSGGGSVAAGSATVGSNPGSAAGSAVTPTPSPTPTPTPTPRPAPAAKDDGLAEAGTGADGRSLYYPRALTEADLAGRTLRDLALMRNTVYARAGHPFRKAWLRDHFTALSWYHALDQDDASKVSDVDRANVKLVAAREVAVPHDELVARRTTLQAGAAPSEADQIELRLLNEQLGGIGGAAANTKASPLEDPSQLDRLLTLDGLADLSQRDLRILRNTVYARHGRTFKSDTLIQWFADKDWYQPDDSFTEASLTPIDRKNVKLIRSVEASLGGPMTEYQQKADEGWFDGA